jgi:hypothetical protein
MKLYFLGDGGICPDCKRAVIISGVTEDGLLLASCGHAFGAQQWEAIAIFKPAERPDITRKTRSRPHGNLQTRPA